MMSNYPLGITFAALLYLSSTLGTIFFLTPLLPLMWLRPAVFRAVVDVLLAWWKVYAVALYEVVFGVKVVISGTPPSVDDGALILMNHRTRLDWLFYMSYELRYGTLRRGKIILKSVLKNIPGPGWAMQCGMFLFLHRKWEVDKPILTKVLHYFQCLKYSPQILLFPEGTDLTAQTQANSHKFARKLNLPEYKYVLHPRTTGFVYLMKKMMDGNSLKSVADITVAYPQNIAQREADLLQGHFPREIHLRVQSYPITDLDTSEQGMVEWCQKLWSEKERTLQKFYTENRKFTTENNSSGDHETDGCEASQQVTTILYTALIFWTSFIVLVLTLLLYSSLIRWFVFLSSLIYFSLVYFYGGVDMSQTAFTPEADR